MDRPDQVTQGPTFSVIELLHAPVIVNTGNDDAGHFRPELSLDALGSETLVFEGVVEQPGDCLVLRPPVFEHEGGHGKEGG